MRTKYNVLPPVYELEDYITCIDKNYLYCKSTARLLRNNGSTNNTVWELIKESMIDENSYDRSLIHRAICVPKKESSDTFIKTSIDERLKGYGLHSNVDETTCMAKGLEISFYDVVFLVFFIVYITFISYATYYDMYQRNMVGSNNNNRVNASSENRIIKSFSLLSNWKKLTKVNAGEDFQKLKSIQGIRFLCMVLIIGLHTSVSYAVVYISNPEGVAEFAGHPVMQYVSVASLFFVQPFFLISSWIVTFQIYDFYNKHGKFTVKDAFIIVVNRYFRLVACLVLLIILTRSNWIKIFDGPMLFENSYTTQKACKQNWLQTLTFANNFLYFKDICIPTSWYMSVDFQLYVAAVVTVYLILRFNLNESKVLSFMFLFSCGFYGIYLYLTGMEVFYRTNANLIRGHSILHSYSLKVYYYATYPNWGTSLMGVSLGLFYIKNKHRTVPNNWVVTSVWLLLFFGLPSAAIFIAKSRLRGIPAAVLGPLIKPLFSLGVGIGILGMSYNIGGIVKRVFENRFSVLMSNFSFSVYVFQFLVVFSKGAGAYSLMEYSMRNMVLSFIFFDLPMSITVGIICTLIFEQPAINLQKIFVPQLPSKQPHARKD
ncbi:hypothetical protein NQ315_009504 [Exocentrus adspersus]|uniref:Acyltransferase 3 domain-containing protein n=1 Tax=Exocentrus adspersus TaxID=1586481 RepID=A0AAV8WG99_9CUCU|nr:hypothetical protein NQ315_009504 [Exocentrus adspersus]